jgi:isopentenyl phosphate kinase
MRSNLALIKMGGSVVTFKDRPLSANYTAIEEIMKAITLLKGIPIILVHGGGSFGHYWSVKYNMHTRPDKYDSHGISIVHESMIHLNQIIVNSMIKNGLNPYSVSAFAFTNGKMPVKTKLKQLYAMAQTGLIPVTYGDVVHINDGKFSILSGDVIMTMIAKILNPSKVIFTVNTEGIYRDIGKKEIIREVTSAVVKNAGLFRSTRSQPFPDIPDITGGMSRKVKEAIKISTIGAEVMIVNGLKPERIIQAVCSGPENFEGTVVTGRGRSLQSKK